MKKKNNKIVEMWAEKILTSFYSQPLFQKPLNELIKDYLKLSNHKWRVKRNLKDTIFGEIIRDYLQKDLLKTAIEEVL